MKSRKSIKSIVFTSVIGIVTMLFVTISMAADTGKVSVETARLRDQASENSTILELISIGEEVEILGESNGWYQVRYKGITGYLRNDLLDVENGGSTTDNSGAEQVSTTPENETENNAVQNNSTEGAENQVNNQTAQDNTTSNNVTEGEQNASQAEVNQNTENTNQNGETAENTENANVEEDLTGNYQLVADTDMKITPLVNSLSVENLKQGSTFKIEDKANDWVLVNSENNQGWIRFSLLQKVDETQEPVQSTAGVTGTENTEEASETTETQEPTANQTKTMYVNSQTVNVRSNPNQASSIVTQLPINEQVTVISEQNGWSQITFDGGEGYISSSLLSDTRQETSRGSSTSRTETDLSNSQSGQSSQSNTQSNSSTQNDSTSSSAGLSTSTSSSRGSEVLAYAMKFVGYPYVYGGSSPSGFDCSGFTSYVYKHFGVSLSRTAAGQYSNGTAVSRANLQVGDLVMFGSPINHVGIYAGGGRIVHAANPSRGVTTDTINSGYYNTHYVGARRIF